MRVMILAAGLGTRLRPLTLTTPKCLVPIHGKPLLDYWFELLFPDDLAAGEITRARINTSYLAEAVRRHMAASPWRNRVELVHEEGLLGTGGTVLANEAFFADAPFMVVHGDNLTRFDVAAFIDRHRRRPAGAEITMMTFATDVPTSCGIVELDERGLVVGFHEKVENPPGNQANAAVYIFEPTVLAFMRSLGRPVIDISTEVIPAFLGRITTFSNTLYHRDIGSMESLQKAHEDYPAETLRLASTRRVLHPVLLSGGSGVRLWPMSRERLPKQVLNLTSERSMIQETALRVAAAPRFAPPLVICNEEHRFVIAEHLREAGIVPTDIVLEPVGRNTAMAVAVAALRIGAVDPGALMLILPADHLIRDLPAFHDAVDRAAEAAAAGHMVTFGISPTGPETGYGYIRRGGGVAGCEGTFRVAAFVEKPSRAVAETYVNGGAHYWNSGMFLFPVAKVLGELERFAPKVLAAARQAVAGALPAYDFFRLDAKAFESAPSISIDYAVMEHTESAVVVPAEFGWTDIGTWAALWAVSAKDEDGNVQVGDVIGRNNRDCYIRSEGPLTAVLGIENAVIVVTDDAVMVAARDRVGELKLMVDELKRLGRAELVTHQKVHRPWGYYRSLHTGDRFQVKRLTVNPGASLSLQFHYHRAEHWVVVSGTALVTCGEEKRLVRENESIFVPLGVPHRLENPGQLPLNLIEVQSGAYLGEDDIVRLSEGGV